MDAGAAGSGEDAGAAGSAQDAGAAGSGASVTLPCAGLSVVEVVVGTSELGLGLAGSLPGMVLADLGAHVVRVTGEEPLALDAGLTWGRPWHRDKELVATDDVDEIRDLLTGADVALVYGPETLVEARGLGYRDVGRTNPALVYARLRPSATSAGAVEDYGLLVEARAGFCTQLRGHRDGPIFVDVRAPGIGGASLLTASVFALLRRRAQTGAGGWAETSLYDGMLATLGCMIGRSERAAPDIEGYWERGSTFPNFLYRCADGELIQVWFGGKGMYDKLIAALGDEPSEEGYYADQMAGRLGDRAKAWIPFFEKETRDVWIERLRAVGVACEPVYGPGEGLSDPQCVAVGLAVERTEDGHHDVVLGTPISITSLAPADEDEDGYEDEVRGDRGGDGDGEREHGAEGVPGAPAAATSPTGPGLLEGLKVLDFSAFVAGPLAAQVLADLGAEVIKVEPPGGEAMRAAAYAVAACQRGKRSVALDVNAPEARPVVEGLIRWADVVLHNFRVGVSERLGIDEATVARLNPEAVYCHASSFGTTGPRAKAPGNDALMQALTGLERAIGGEGNDPIAGTWIPLDMAGGWLAAIGTLAGLHARATTGEGQRVSTILLGAGMLLQSGAFQRDGEVVPGPTLDGDQTGYGPGYRIYRCGDDAWLALVVPDDDAWAAVAAVTGATLPAYAPLRGGQDDAFARRAEAALELAFATAPATEWVERLRAASVPVELVVDLDRDGFRRHILDDPVNRQLGRVVAYDTADWGHFEQIGPLLRYGPDAGAGPPLMLPGVGEHSVEVLAELGVAPADIDALLAADVLRQG